MGDETNTTEGNGEVKALGEMTKRELLEVIEQQEARIAALESAPSPAASSASEVGVIPVVLRRKLPREDFRFEVGDTIGGVILEPGCDLNTLVDAVRNHFASEG